MSVTTTHDPAGGGHPRLILSAGSSARLGAEGPPTGTRPEVELRPGVTSIGSDDDADLRLPGLASRHGEVRRTDDDEYLYIPLTAHPASTVNGVPVAHKPLHTGDRLQLGGWSMSFYRDECADHGRPHGGRQGGEGSYQRPQHTPRPRGTTTDGGQQPHGDDPGEYF